jgi:hypothetical protein
MSGQKKTKLTFQTERENLWTKHVGQRKSI